MDALSALLQDVRAGGALFGRTHLVAPWALRFEDPATLTLVAMLRGAGWLRPDTGPAVALAAGDVAAVRGGTPFTVADDAEGVRAPYCAMRGRDEFTDAAGRPVEHADLTIGLRACGDRLDAPDVVLTAGFPVGGRLANRVLDALPPVVVVPNGEGQQPVLTLLAAEFERDAQGQDAVIDRLLEVLLLTSLRTWFARTEASPPRWFRAMADPVVGGALRLMHESPAHPWTVAELAARVAVSRATFARRFVRIMDEPPMAYLTGWRLALASDLLEASDATLASIARRVGYADAYALSAAFKRHLGTRPSQHRRASSAA